MHGEFPKSFSRVNFNRVIYFPNLTALVRVFRIFVHCQSYKQCEASRLELLVRPRIA